MATNWTTQDKASSTDNWTATDKKQNMEATWDDMSDTSDLWNTISTNYWKWLPSWSFSGKATTRDTD